MNRRQFLRNIVAGVVGAALTDVDVDRLLLQTSHLTDEEFSFQAVTYINMVFNMYVSNPSHYAIITNITDIEDE